jgi:hypothetical protein
MVSSKYPEPLSSRTFTGRIPASGATPTEEMPPAEVTIPATLVPWPLPSSAAPVPDWRLNPLGQQPPMQKHSWPTMSSDRSV